MPCPSSSRRGAWRLLCLLCCSFFDAARGQIRYSVLEELDRGSFVGNIAKDLGIDVIRLNSRGLKIMSRSRRQHFQVNMNSGVLLTSEKIDREELCAESPSCKLNLELVIDSPLEMHRLEVEVLDVNDHAPHFPENEVTLDVAESAIPGSRFPIANAIDLDIGINGVQSYILSPMDFFNLTSGSNSDESTLELTLTKALDREVQDVHMLFLSAIDGGNPKRSGSTNITVKVIDTNDNAPAFDRAVYSVKLPENVPFGTSVLQLSATDLDEGLNGEVRYFFDKRVPMSTQNTFKLEETTGVISVQGSIDFEHSQVYKFSVEALDQGPYPVAGRCQVSVEIIDENDNAPEITVTTVSGSVPEDAKPGTVIALMIVSDKDSGDNGRVVCSVPSTLPFALQNPYNNHYSLLLKDPLDRESTEEHIIMITAVDRGSPPLTTSTTIKVQVSDTNDNSPKFTQPAYTMYVTENNVPGTHVSTISATDLDTKENGYLTYSISANTTLDGFISINSENGKLYALKSFDYEEIQHLEFLVHCKDAGVPPLSSSVPVQLFIQDQNDNAPAILLPPPQMGSTSVGAIPRSAEAGYLVSKIRAFDADSGYNAWLAYDIIQSRKDSLFKVGLSTGEVRTSRSIRDQDGSHHRLLIQVKDHGEPALSSSVTLSITITENDKEIHNEYFKHPESDVTISNVNLYLVISIAFISFIFLVTIIIFIALKIYKTSSSTAGCDQALCDNNRGSWYYTQSNSYKVYLGKASKDILLFNSQCPPQPGDSINKRLTLTTETPAQQSVDDLLMIGDNKIRYSVLEELDRGSFVGNIAKDLGIDVISLNSRGLKIMSRSRRQHFQVNMNSGVLLTSEKIDREELCAESPSCKLNLELVIDSPLEMHRLEVEVLDVNDHAPRFAEKEVTISILESAIPGSRFQIANANDPDIGINGVQDYKLSPMGFFNLTSRSNSDESTLELTLKKPLDRQVQAVHTLVLTAVDGGNPKRSGSTNITVNVIDTNDNAPAFDRAVYSVKLPENVPLGTSVLQLSATDLDEGLNGEVQYFFDKLVPVSTQNTFKLEETTGVISVQGNIDYELWKVYKFSVEALDKVPFSVAGRCQVSVEIIDENDNAPEITVTSVSGSVPEDAKPGIVIALMIVSDKDSGDNGQVVCSVPATLPFALQNPYNNHYSLVLKDPLDRETTAEHTIIITAMDKGSPPLTTSTTIKVQVSDVNDNSPKFTQPAYTMYVMENNIPGTHMSTISATDLDTKENGYLTYSISANTTLDGLISINSENGKLYALKSFDYEEIQHLEFLVHCKDAGVPPLSSSVPVQLFIHDQNDNAPAILLPPSQMGSTSIEAIPRSAEAGYLVSKIRAFDADSGYNAWLAYDIIQPRKDSLFKVGLSTGEVRTSRSIRVQDGSHHRLLIQVKDHGEPALSSTVTLSITITETEKEIHNEYFKHPESDVTISNVNLYLVISIAFISFIFLVTIIIFVALKIYRTGARMAGCDQALCENNRGSWYYTQSNSYKVYLGKASQDILLFNSQCPPQPGDSINKRLTLTTEAPAQQSVDDLLMIGDNKNSKDLTHKCPN
ncbi:protocadherin gamma-A4-like [Ambystoma mexicanum]|uniref:protocadherin gamma-A4-like n=1 Tax=Ambystoma mexicanum TaxID=8296 RepID=UPI0037E71400